MASTPNTRSRGRRSRACTISIVVLSILIPVTLRGSAQAQDTAAYKDEEFLKQWEAVQAKYPFVAKAFSFLKNLRWPCNINAKCFTRVQQQCLDQDIPPRFCLEQAERVCCEPLVIQPPPDHEPGVVFAGKWCCNTCRETPPVKCTGCQVKTGVCGGDRPIVLDCPGPTTSDMTTGTVTCF